MSRYNDEDIVLTVKDHNCFDVLHSLCGFSFKIYLSYSLIEITRADIDLLGNFVVSQFLDLSVNNGLQDSIRGDVFIQFTVTGELTVVK